MTKYLTVAEVARKIRMSDRGVQGICRKGLIGATKAGKHWLIPQESLDEYLKIRR